MILIGALLFLITVTICIATLDLRFIDKLREQRAAASEMRSFQSLRNESPLTALANENALLNRRVNQLEKKIELLESAPQTAAAFPPPLRSAESRTSELTHSNGARVPADDRNPSLGPHTNGSARVEITPEEMQFLTGDSFESADQSTSARSAKAEMAFKRFQTYFPTNRDLSRHANTSDDLVNFIQSAVIRALRMEGFASKSEIVGHDFLAKFVTNTRFPILAHTPDVRNHLASELMSYIAAHPHKQVRGRGALNGDHQPRPPRRS
jgi:hypothetical protein